VIAGEGPAVRHLRRLTAQLGLDAHVSFVGYLSRTRDLPDCYAAGDVFTFASRTETQGLVLLEAMQAGTPVVSTAVMGTAEVMSDRRGGLVAEEAVEDFAAKVRRLLDEPGLRSKLGAQAVEKAAAWSAPATAQRLLQLYEQRIASAAQRASPQTESA
jgi:1,2-diacylglycerol 3-alpha-glucosyltransferase